MGVSLAFADERSKGSDGMDLQQAAASLSMAVRIQALHKHRAVINEA